MTGRGQIKITNNAPGMDAEKLGNAVRAGYSGNNAVDKLGLFGMGFNVATARLGACTEVWTTRVEDDAWNGVRIDFDDLESSGTFSTPLLSRPKGAGEQWQHGTEVVISKLEADRASYLRTPGGSRYTRDKLSRVYSKIIEELGLELIFAGQGISVRKFCLWNETRSVDTKSRFGRVPVKLPIEKDFGERDYCSDCWVWLMEHEIVCPACNTTVSVRKRPRILSGWIGIQRFFDMEDYGIDLIRNGRVIEERSKHFFSWENDDGETLLEYPIDQTYWGGRIVGQIDCDFVPLASHQKDSFDHSSREWRMMVEEVRGQGPILQNRRRPSGFIDENTSPLAKLHAAYRRGQPAGLRWLVPGDSEGKGINVEPKKWAGLYWRGDTDYQDDDKWYQAASGAEEINNRRRGASLVPFPARYVDTGKLPLTLDSCLRGND